MRSLVVAALLSLGAAMAHATESYALFRLDPLGLPPEIVQRLERILRSELQTAVGALPSEAAVAAVVADNPSLDACTAAPACLAPLFSSLHVTRVVAGNVGGLADAYVVNLKLVDAAGRELRRVRATLRGAPAELIEEIRIATLRLVAPERLVGHLALLSDVPDATVTLDGRRVGRTPLRAPLGPLPIGSHRLAVTRPGFSSVQEEVPIRFEKTTQVVVHQRATEAPLPARPRTPLYARWYLWTGVAVVAVAAGVAVGFALPKQRPIDCAAGGCP